MGILIQPPGIVPVGFGTFPNAVTAIVPKSTPANGTAAVNTAVVLTVAGVAGQRIVLTELSWSYNAAPTGGRVFVQDGATTVLDLDLAASGPGSLPFHDGGITMTLGNTLTVTLAAAGAAVTGKLNIGTITGVP